MKPKYITFALLGLIGVSCSNQDLEEKYTDAGQVQVTADIAKSRVSFNETDDMTYAYWQTGDAITLSTPTQGNLNYTATVSEDDATVATFAPEEGSLKDIADETVYACYPAATITDGVVTLPATNIWTDAQPLPFAYAVSSITDSKVDLNFEHTFAFLKLTLDSRPLANVASTDGDKTVHSLLIKSATESLGVVSGTFNFEDKSVNITEGSNEVKFTLGTAFNPSEETERSIYIPILPQSGDVAMTISLIHTHNSGEDVLLTMDKQTPTNGFVAGRVYTLALTGNSSAVIEGESGEIHLAVAGTLSNYITDENKYTIKSLKLSGYLNGDDIRLLREMAGVDVFGYETEGQLTDIDLSEATIVEGGECYYNSSTDYYTSNNIWGKYFFMDSKLTNIILPKNIKEMWGYAFENCASLESIEIPEGVTYIGWSCFQNSELKNIILPESLQTIAQSAFMYCKSLEEIVIPDNAEVEIQKYAFNGCTSLKTLSLGKGVTIIGDCAFEECSNLLSVTIPENAALSSIGKEAFKDCDYLTNFTIPDGVPVSIGEEAFYDCDALGSVSLGNAVVSIGASAFRYCSSLATVYMGDAVTEIGESAFRDCTTLTQFTMSKGLVSLGGSAFDHCSSLTTISIPDGVTVIEGGTFNYCKKLKSIVIPDGVTSIGNSAFYYCSSLTDVTLGSSIKTIGKSTFSWCGALKKIAIPNSVTTISDAAFERCTSLEEVTMGTGILTIDTSAFYECGALKEIILPESIEYIGGAAFFECTSLTKAQNVIAETGNIFDKCSSLIEVTINPKTTKIGQHAFNACTSLANVNIPDGVLAIESNAFKSCYALKEVSIPESVVLIGSGAFMFCESLDNVVIPDKITVLKEDVLFDLKSLTKVTIGKSVTTIEDGNFGLNLGGTYLSKVECICKPTTPPILKGNIDFSTAEDDVAAAKLYVPKGSLTAYQESDWATYFGNIIEMEE